MTSYEGSGAPALGPDQTVTALLILPDGTIGEWGWTDPLALAYELIGHDLDVNTCGHPTLEPGEYVLVVDDWGLAKGLPLNRKAWALYGRSPIYGRALFFRDDHGPLSAVAIRVAIDGPDARLAAVMDAWLDQHPDFPR